MTNRMSHICQSACAGALVGPPWAKRENGFLFSETAAGGITLYYEPHCDYDADSLQGVDSVDIVITPGVNQELLSFPLVTYISPSTYSATPLPLCFLICSTSKTLMH